MAKTPVEMLMDSADWTAVDVQPAEDGLPYATHEGVLRLGGFSLRCYRLNTGEAVFHADDVNAFFAGALTP